MPKKQRNRSADPRRGPVPSQRDMALAQEKFRQAAGFHANGQLITAAMLYREVLTLIPDQPETLHWLGVIEGQAGHLGEAVRLLELSVAGNPRDVGALGDLGTALRAINRREEAVTAYDRALQLAPQLAKVWSDRGVVLAELGRSVEALTSFDRALAVQPIDAETLARSARVAAGTGDYTEALRRATAALSVAESDLSRQVCGEVLARLRFVKKDETAQAWLIRALDEAWARPTELLEAGLSMLRCDAEVAQVLTKWGGDVAASRVSDTIEATHELSLVLAHPLLLCLLRNVQLNDIEVERLLTRLRADALRRFMTGGDGRSADFNEPADVSTDDLRFACALAHQCFINDYVYALAEDEVELAEKARSRLESAIAECAGSPLTKSRIAARSLALVAAYFPLGELQGADQLLQDEWPEPAAELIRRQITEPREERRIAATLPVIANAINAVSLAVQSQYEDNPYPRWVNCPRFRQNASPEEYLGGRFPGVSLLPREVGEDVLNVLVAGCGTGQNPIDAALLYRNAQIVAVDLSRRSLAYAARKTRELGIDSIEFAQGDILALGAWDRRFDIIECMGVLHHLENPLAGWRVLVSLLRPGGFMNLGLYSERARRGVVAARPFIAEQGYRSMPQDIRRCRQALLANTQDPDIAHVVRAPDFFGTSTCRDLLFHVQEHRYTLPRLRDELNELGLRFLGFELDASVRARYVERFGAERNTDLDAWDAFEQQCPDTFSGMYQFWVQKSS